MKFRCLAILLAFVPIVGVAIGAHSQALPAGIMAIPLATITNDRDASTNRFELMVDKDGTVRGIYLVTRVTNKNGTTSRSTEVYPLKDIETGDGVVLGQGKGHKAILLRGTISSRKGRGSLVIRYLKNGLFRHYKECRLNLDKRGPHDWQLVNAYDGQPITHINVVTWALGISTLTNVCPDSG